MAVAEKLRKGLVAGLAGIVLACPVYSAEPSAESKQPSIASPVVQKQREYSFDDYKKALDREDEYHNNRWKSLRQYEQDKKVNLEKRLRERWDHYSPKEKDALIKLYTEPEGYLKLFKERDREGYERFVRFEKLYQEASQEPNSAEGVELLNLFLNAHYFEDFCYKIDIRNLSDRIALSSDMKEQKEDKKQ